MKIVWLYNICVDKEMHITTWLEMYNNLKEFHDIFFIFPYYNRKINFVPNITFIKHRTKVKYLKRIIYILAVSISYIKLARKINPDIIITDIWTFYLPIFNPFLKHRPHYMMDMRTCFHNEFSEKNTFRDFIAKIWTKSALLYNRYFYDGITFITNALKETLQVDLGVTCNRNSHIWSSGVNIQLFNPMRHYSQHNFHNKFVILYHGEVTENRGLFETIKAVEILRAKGIPILFLVIGDGEYRSQIEDYVASKRMTESILLMGFKPYAELPGLIMSADVCMMAYPLLKYWEVNSPLKLLEYLAMNKVIILTQLKIFKETVENEKCAIYIPNNEPENIATAILHAYEHRNELSAWGSAGRNIVKKRYTWDDITVDFNEFLKKFEHLY